MNTALDWISGISWSLVYLIAIRLGIRRKTYCIPAVCICLNFSWEMWAVLARVVERSPLNSGFLSQLLWLVLDVGILYTWIRYAEGTSWKKKLMLLGGSAIVMAAATLGADLWEESAFIINLIMSAAFLFQIDRQMWPSLLVAILKCAGTLPATILNGIIYRNLPVLTTGGLCLIADLRYIYETWMEWKTATLKEQMK